MLIRCLWGETRETGCKNSLIQSHNVRIMRQMRLFFTGETTFTVLITRRSQVQVLPPQPKPLKLQRFQGFLHALLQFAVDLPCEPPACFDQSSALKIASSSSDVIGCLEIGICTKVGNAAEFAHAAYFCFFCATVRVEKSGSWMSANLPRVFVPLSLGAVTSFPTSR